MHYILYYDLVDDYVQRRAPFQGAHLKLALEAHHRGELVLAGAMADCATEAMLVFGEYPPDAAVKFANADPYVLNGLVKSWHVRKWNTVIGDSVSPVR